MSPTPTSRRSKLTASQQEGFSLAALIVILTIISIVIAYTVPAQWSMVMKRERDRQTIFLMKQFARGILEWTARHNSAPVSLQQMQDARKPLLLRNGGKWACPITGKEDDWILVPPEAIDRSGMPPGNGPRLNPAPPPVAPGTGPSKLNKALSPKDYTGQFIGVRPNATGKSFIAFNDAEDYSEWVYTVEDLRREIAQRQASLATP
jgi:type II secretory pathway pseudopilin PulG